MLGAVTGYPMTAVEEAQTHPMEASRSDLGDLDFLLCILDIARAGLETTCLVLNL